LATATRADLDLSACPGKEMIHEVGGSCKVPDVLIRCPPKSNIADVHAAWKLVAEKR
jgi:hypothetical protein